ncbi:hypothetical protein VJI72_01550 [Parvimonas micra]|uniref:hypothetical protein n=1 Tax=Parvimonas micra TaxID=33033 RepID=UPI002B480438|nr:hypothetical protein [Parvimonas micra]MEB3028476.1 hypothetical protein [Parvimonas micra]
MDCGQKVYACYLPLVHDFCLFVYGLTQKEFEDLSRDEILKKRIEYLKENNLL